MNLLQMSFAAALMIAAISIIRALSINRLPKKTFLALWCIVLLRLLIPFSIPSATSIYSLLPDPPLDYSAPVTTEQTSFIESPVFWEPQPDTAVQDTFVTEQAVQMAEQIAQTSSPDVQRPLPFWKEVIFAVWATGAVLLALYFTVGYVRSIREFRTSLPVENPLFSAWQQQLPLRRKISIRQLDRIHSPLTYGIFHPVILLPKESLKQNPEALIYILTHEYIHIRRFDNLTKLLFTAALCLHWFNPLVWLMYVLLNRDLELSCDESVLRLLGENNRSAYAMTLIDMKEVQSGFRPLYSSFNKNAIEERIRAIMKMKKLSVISIVTALALVAGVTSVFATSPKPTTTDVIQEYGVYNELDLETYAPYEAYGMTYDKDQKVFLYEGKPVRFFYDAGVGASFTNFVKGEVDVEATRDDNNKLTGLHHSTEEAYNRRTERAAAISSTAVEAEDSIAVTETSRVNLSAVAEAEETVAVSDNSKEAVSTTNEKSDISSFFKNIFSIFHREEASNSSSQGSFSQQELLDLYGKYGISFDKKGNMLFNGEMVRYFIDGVRLKPYAGSYTLDRLDNAGSTSTYYQYLNQKGSVDIYTVRDIIDNGDGSINPFGKLQSIQKCSESVFNARKLSSLEKEISSPDTQTLEQRFAPYKKYGVDLKPSKNDSRLYDVYYNGELVCIFCDRKPSGSIFSFCSQNTNSNMVLYTVYDKNGNLSGVKQTFREKKGTTFTIKPLLRSECNSLTEYFESFFLYGGFTFEPSPDNDQSGNLYDFEGNLISDFSDTREEDPFFFRSADYDGVYSASYNGTGSAFISSVVPAPSLWQFRDEPVEYDFEKKVWTFRGKPIHWVIDGNFASSIQQDGEINLIAAYQDGVRQPLKEISLEEAEKLSIERLTPASFNEPVKNPTQVKDVNGRRLYYAPEGTEVTCAVSGRVMYAGWQKGYGYCVEIMDDAGVTWTYAHLKEALAKNNITVSAGDAIGTVGSSGSADKFYLGLSAAQNKESIDINLLCPMK